MTTETPEQTVQESEVFEAVAEEAEETLEAAAQEESARKLTKTEILAKMKEIAEDVEHASKAEIDALKQNFYKLHNAEIEAAKQAFLEGGGNVEDFVPEHDADEDEFKQVMTVVKEKRNRFYSLERIAFCIKHFHIEQGF